MLQADLTTSEVPAPPMRYCPGWGGHEAAETFVRDGAPAPTRFFRVSAKTQDFGVLCEPCLIVATWWSRLTPTQRAQAVAQVQRACG